MRKNGWNPGLQYSDFLYLIAAKGVFNYCLRQVSDSEFHTVFINGNKIE